MRISDWSSDVCSSDLVEPGTAHVGVDVAAADLDRLRRHIGAQPRGHPDQPVAGEYRVGHTRRIRDHRGEAGVEMIGVEAGRKIGRAWCRERVCQTVWISVVAGPLKKK